VDLWSFAISAKFRVRNLTQYYCERLLVLSGTLQLVACYSKR